ncbi:hypothetical protein J1N35_023112 [Gossypium stocksii]|uniref:Uncharacterized protein n=1 Tax=Gossypium stocksii TaxID=47602 RepID=A0A9D3VI70_9ROSI|nr:hypothetical protein J1N35_023112 [Gossypium stocksii]
MARWYGLSNSEYGRGLSSRNSRDLMLNLGANINPRFQFINEWIILGFNEAYKEGVGSNGFQATVNGLMELGSDGENSPIQLDDGKNGKGL